MAEDESKGPAYRIHTERLVLRCWNPADAPLLKQAIDSSLEHLRPWMPWAKHEPEALEIHCDPINARSAAVPKKLGFVHEATLRYRTVTAEGAPRDSMIWTMLASEYGASRVAEIGLEAFDAAGQRIL